MTGRGPNTDFFSIQGIAHQTVCYVLPFYSLAIEELLSFSNLVNFLFTRAQTEAKRCVKNLIDSDNNFPSQAKEALDLGLSDYNPFYADNRDPGATGSDQCDGVQDKSGDGLKYFNAGNGIKPGILQALMFTYFSLFFFF